ncbi:hypothetical protein [Nocardiopsis ansamitocini]|uniref:Uncharacterized protein n=1 Tax=Nocardiopsis ansamitocini TaxID=1670832 RepID=A0A9W6P3D9_9ACTN|nr:hypothetical protein [Nocardiopsis ansamitocini]GLU46298.1 hypothetical protein Nans01_06490 [Nocardiopsis ansamitocini]
MHQPPLLPGIPAELLVDPDLFAIALDNEDDAELAARRAAAADIAAHYLGCGTDSDDGGPADLVLSIVRTAPVWDVCDEELTRWAA